MKIKELLHKAFSIILPLGMMVSGLCLASCEETAEVDEFANWKVRNTEFIDSIAAIAKANTDGKWMRILSFKLDDTDINGNPAEFDNEDYIYCQVIEKGTDSASPKFTDTVQVNYRGRLIPTLSFPEGKVFDQSYKGVLNPATAVPSKFSVGGVIVGWSTALQKMTTGDLWRVYIPADLAYGSSKQTDIPAYSALIFDMNLVGFYPIGTPVPNI